MFSTFPDDRNVITVADRPVPTAALIAMGDDRTAVRTWFENGMILSTVWGHGMYSDDDGAMAARTVEVAVWSDLHATGLFALPGGDTVAGWVTPEAWWALHDLVAALPSDATTADTPAFAAWDRDRHAVTA
jgi:hypothetical protein